MVNTVLELHIKGAGGTGGATNFPCRTGVGLPSTDTEQFVEDEQIGQVQP